ncbi:E3 ubiquitin/ISG15 ligase TRIM25-like [Triplophysa dalaica]|uniref:E3 ubiquitin/ISG15 ligase TRIM25-like n=1 Tax=Triplophysa dalaica TaxID=1582913 RepID=UPI0024DFA7B4|nr:E3 ubiquitin/ISG15 ligase TRIM25-like [Triplophysa dalaica]
MAEARIPVEQLTCPVCLDLLNDPVTIPCGHSYCMSCINDCWDWTRVYSCPHCRRVFTPRPDLGKNIILTEMIEKLKQIQVQAADPTHSYAGVVDVCDMCIGRKDKAVKSCLMCLKSYCHAHFEHHKMVYSGKAHEVIDATRLQENICRQHNKQLDVFCRTDQQLICSLCTRDEHKKHDTVPAVAERTEKQRFQSFSGPDIPVEISDLTSLFSDEDVGKLLKVLQLKSKTVPRPRPSSVAFQSSAYTPATSKPQVWPPTPPKPRPRPSSIALNT